MARTNRITWILSIFPWLVNIATASCFTEKAFSQSTVFNAILLKQKSTHGKSYPSHLKKRKIHSLKRNVKFQKQSYVCTIPSNKCGYYMYCLTLEIWYTCCLYRCFTLDTSTRLQVAKTNWASDDTKTHLAWLRQLHRLPSPFFPLCINTLTYIITKIKWNTIQTANMLVKRSEVNVRKRKDP